MAPQHVGVGPFNAHGDAGQPDAGERLQRFGWQQIDAAFNRELHRPIEPANALGQFQRAATIEAEQRIAKLERAKTEPLHTMSHFICNGRRIAKADADAAGKVGAVVAFQRAAAALLDVRAGEFPEIEADAKPPRSERIPVGLRQRVEICDLADAHALRPGGEHFVEFPKELLRFAVDDRHRQASQRRREPASHGSDHQQLGPERLIKRRGHGLALQIDGGQGRIEDVNVGPRRHAVERILDVVAQPAEDGREIGKAQRRGSAITAKEMPNQPMAEPVRAVKLTHAESAGKILGHIAAARVPKHNPHQFHLASSTGERRAGFVPMAGRLGGAGGFMLGCETDSTFPRPSNW